MTDKLSVSNVYKVFGPDPEQGLKLVQEGKSKDQIFAETGNTVGVNNASFTVREGEIFVIMGLSGSGKSTLVRLLNRLIEPTSGEVVVAGENITGASQEKLRDIRREHMAMVFQSFALMPHMTVIQNAAFGLEIAGMEKTERESRAQTALDAVGLGHMATKWPSECSGGMQQRVGLARALANDPSILLMDEAFSALDPLIRTEMQDELLRLQSEQSRTIVFISHDLDEAMRIGDRIAIMEGGRIVQIGTPEEILNDPADDYVASFFKGVNKGTVLKAADVARKTQVTVIDKDDKGVRTAMKRLSEYDRQHGYVVDGKGQYHGVVSYDSLEAIAQDPEPMLSKAYLPDVEPIVDETVIWDILGKVAAAPCGVPVVDEKGRYKGVISKAVLLESMDKGE
ncbi:MAG: glycine betaine/L-proline ABC transporter ATP-binding protein ProV [Rhodospirillaceae bacterium]